MESGDAVLDSSPDGLPPGASPAHLGKASVRDGAVSPGGTGPGLLPPGARETTDPWSTGSGAPGGRGRPRSLGSHLLSTYCEDNDIPSLDVSVELRMSGWVRVAMKGCR